MEQDICREAFIRILCARLNISRETFDELGVEVMCQEDMDDTQVMVRIPVRTPSGKQVTTYDFIASFNVMKRTLN